MTGSGSQVRKFALSGGWISRRGCWAEGTQGQVHHSWSFKSWSWHFSPWPSCLYSSSRNPIDFTFKLIPESAFSRQVHYHHPVCLPVILACVIAAASYLVPTPALSMQQPRWPLYQISSFFCSRPSNDYRWHSGEMKVPITVSELISGHLPASSPPAALVFLLLPEHTSHAPMLGPFPSVWNASPGNCMACCLHIFAQMLSSQKGSLDHSI